jgi:hypothetical protein
MVLFLPHIIMPKTSNAHRFGSRDFVQEEPS